MNTAIRYLRLYLYSPAGRQAIGHLSQYGDILRVSFDESYIQDIDRPTLSLSYQGAQDSVTREILTSMRDTRIVRTDGRWPVFFQNLLPEGHNRERLARERGCAVEDEFELLAAAGHDLMGALEAEPVPEDEGIPDSVRLWHTSMGLDAVEPGFVELPVEDAAAIPGVVTKFSAILDGRRYIVRRRGQAGSFILKLPSTRHPDLVANEFMGYTLMDALGLDCAQARVISRKEAELPEAIPFEDILAVKRFDRGPDNTRVHMEEFAQVLGYAPRHKYGKGVGQDFVAMLTVLDRLSGRPARDVPELLNRFVAFIAMGNTDAHLKNWALVYPDAHTPRLAPLYDPVSVSSFFSQVPETDYGVNRAIDAKLRVLSWEDIDGLLKEARILRRAQYIRGAKELLRRARADWPGLLEQAPKAMREEIGRRLAGGVRVAMV
jgi:serine/threonine-protein kinase HipA